MNKKISFAVLASSLLLGLASTAFAAVIPPPPPTLPTDASECKKDGWRNYGDTFKNQGDCVSFVATNGRNEPDGPPIH